MTSRAVNQKTQMRHGIGFALIVLIALSMFLTVFTGKVSAVDTTLSVIPQTIWALPGESFSVNINVSNVVDLYGVDFHLGYNTAVLTATGTELGDFFPPDAWIIVETIDDDAGFVWYAVQFKIGTPPPGKDGNGTIVKIFFMVDDYGSGALDLYGTDMRDSGGAIVDHIAVDGYFNNVPTTIMHPIAVPDVDTFYVETVSNSTVANMTFSDIGKNITFTVTGPDGTKGFCNVTIPKALMWVDTLVEWTLYINGAPATFDSIGENDTHTFFDITYTHSPHEITIKSIYAVPEFTSATSISIFIIVTLIAVITTMVIRKNRSRLIKRPSQNPSSPR